MAELPKPDIDGTCLHCGNGVNFDLPLITVDYKEKINPQYYIEGEGFYSLVGSRCPSCKQFILIRQRLKLKPEQHWVDDILIWPRGVTRTIPKGFSPEIERDFKEACETLYVSKRASAALSRRCLQSLLREKEGVHKKTLYEEIEDVLNANTLPSPLQNTLHMIRNLGNIAAHPLKEETTGKIFDVEEREAQLMIDAVADLLDYYDRLKKYETTAKAAGQKAASQQRPPKKK